MTQRTRATWAIIVMGLLLLASTFGIGWYDRIAANAAPQSRELTLANIPFDGGQAFSYLEKICELGPRVSGSEAMRRQQELLVTHFEGLGAKVTRQSWPTRHPETGANVELTNLIVEWHPERRERILLCAHYDTRPYADEEPDPRQQRQPFLGANDGASGVALLMQLGHDMAKLSGKFGVDFVFFDAEEFIFVKERDPFFLGSRFFARDYATRVHDFRYVRGVLLDMVGDRELHLYWERNSYYDRDARKICAEIWNTAKRSGVKEFVPRPGHELKDDHLALIEIAKIPTCDIIDFDYPRPGRVSYWHTTQDIPANCSALSLAKVGWVVRQWLEEQNSK